tara:strand:- start:2098 stop:3834 length:1737 start_codon:yes stop_codon:yes gene_type:complete
MAENNSAAGGAIVDPFRRKLMRQFKMAQADNGTDDPNGLNTEVTEGAPLNTDGDGDGSPPKPTEPGGTEFTPDDTGIRASILAGVNADFEANLATVQQNAARRRQTRSGVTSQNELREARNAQDRRISLLGAFETSERTRKDEILSAQAISERQLTLGREQLLANHAIQVLKGSQSLGSIAAQGAEDRSTQAPVLLLKRQEQTGQISGSSQATMESVNNIIFKDGVVDTRIVNAIIGGERHSALAAAFSDDQGVLTDPDGYEEAVLSAVFRTAAADPSLWDAATGKTDTEESLGFKRVELEARQVDLAERSQIFNEKVTEAQLTGIWKAYGVDEIDEFTVAYGVGETKKGDANYNARYDMNNDGVIDFSNDFIQFSAAAQVGGIETLAMQNLRAETEQFDITTQVGMDQFITAIETQVAEGNLTRAQERFITAQMLQSNEKMKDNELDVTRVLGLIDILGSDAVDNFTDPQLIAMTEIIMQDQENIDDALATFGLTRSRLDYAHSLTTSFQTFLDNPDAEEGFLGIDAGDIHSWYNVAIADIGSISEEEREVWLQAADIDGDGDITPMDQFYYAIMES